jgi:GTPase
VRFLDNTTIAPKYQAVLHVGSIRQTVRIISMDNPKGILRTGDRATVVFEFVGNPEFVKEGMKLLFREGQYDTAILFCSCGSEY